MSSHTGLPVAEGTFRYGIHPPENKSLAEDVPIQVMPTPGSVQVPLLQHIGAPCLAVVKPKTEVSPGDVIGSSDAFVSAPVHATIAGKTGREGACTLPNGRRVPLVPITAEGDQLEGDALYADLFGGDWDYDQVRQYEPDAIRAAVRNGGLVGMGGAAFPTHVKLAVKPEQKIQTLLVNGCECEPYLTADNRMMIEAPRAIVLGALLAAKSVGAGEVMIGVENNKPRAIQALTDAVAGTIARVKVLATKYPQGGEKQLIMAALGKVVPTGGLPLQVGVVVVNVGTSIAIARAVCRNKPVTHRVITVSGGGVVEPKNILAPIGVSYGDLLSFAGGIRPEAVRLIAGGPMMGFSFGDIDTPVTKGTSGITVLTRREVERAAQTNCVRCGACVDVCPLNLVPTRLALATRYRNWEVAKDYHIGACMECGSCAFICPAQLPLVQLIRMGKASMPRD